MELIIILFSVLDILSWKRAGQKLLGFNVKLAFKDAIAGDITSVNSNGEQYNFIKTVDDIVSRVTSEETVLYLSELKVYSNKVK